MNKKYPVYNLEFPMNCSEFNIYGYKFKKVKNYEDNFSKLQNIFSHDKSKINLNPGGNIITGIAEPVQKEKNPILEWKKKKRKSLR
ncbi:unnamed protein product [marine sediment metagenome]|uniref:Uncharacterized protein n=1 Tax=marine sediment metagenome TaxID=412755 RepID=X1FC44_9ZZZZ